MSKFSCFHVLLTLYVAVGASIIWAQEAEKPAEPRNTAAFNLGKDKLAIQGYDPVAYFPESGGAPQKGDKNIALVHEGVRYHFASEANRDAFKADPAKYEPQHGGWCSYAMADGNKVKIDPDEYSIKDGRLFLLYSKKVTKLWKEDEAGLIPKADQEWTKVTENEASKGAKKKGSGSKKR